MNIKKTNAIRILDQHKINYSLAEYEVDESDLSAVHISETTHIPIEKLYKTLVLRGNKTGIFICVIPGNENIDLKKAAKNTGNKSCEMTHVKELLNLTGYIRGGCSPIGMKKNYPTYINTSALAFDEIYISAGQRGKQIILNPNDLIALTEATVCDLIVE